MRALTLLLFLALAACAGKPAHPAPPDAAGVMSWRSLATADDRKRLREWRTAWVAALAKAKATNPNDVAAAGVLLEPDTPPLDDVAPPPGDYRCRVVKLGAQEAGMMDFVAYPAFACRIGPGAGGAAAAEAAPSGPGDAGAVDFVKADGSQRPVGRLFPDTRRRMAFLGTLQLGDERGTLRYGHDQARDMAGILQRIGERRWRLVFPYPHFESLLDVVELVPAG
jgi:hypothetical protein